MIQMGEHFFHLIERLQKENAELKELLKEQLKISGKCCYTKSSSYKEIKSKLAELGYSDDDVKQTIGDL